MSLDELTQQVEDHRTTRRLIVKTGAKLSYAAPLVAATFKLGTLDASAQAVSPDCPCDPAADCKGNPECFCVTSYTNVPFYSNDFTDSTNMTWLCCAPHCQC